MLTLFVTPVVYTYLDAVETWATFRKPAQVAHTAPTG